MLSHHLACSKSTTISVLLATYNGSRFVLEQLQSVVNQTLAPLEVVVCDDGSTDDTVAIVRQFAQDSSVTVRVHENEKNKGYSRNFLDGMVLCNGEYVAFCDQDDVWHAEKLERLVLALQRTGWPGLCFSDCERVDVNLNSLGGRGMHYLGLSAQAINAISNGGLFERLLLKPCVVGMTMLCHRKKALAMNLAELGIAHDYALSFVFSGLGDYVYVDEPLVLYRQHERNLVGMQTAKAPQNKKLGRSSNFTGLSGLAGSAPLANRDLLDRLNLIQILKSQAIPHDPTTVPIEVHVLDVLDSFIRSRLARRSSWLRCGFPSVRMAAPLNRFYGPKEAFKMWLKDFKSALRYHFRASPPES